ncbi:MAG: threonine/homoserine/homoserine lactone efflux protein [Ascidiaceihabitans sp.]|jgi:threonine/homoserine/homoserine lactone efflux protein
MNIANPKITIFFLAFLPQFVDPANGSMTAQFCQFGALMAVTTVAIFGSIALAAGALGDWIKGSSRTQIWLNRISGVVFVALALKLASAEK